jgi:hypothetical protein
MNFDHFYCIRVVKARVLSFDLAEKFCSKRMAPGHVEMVEIFGSILSKLEYNALQWNPPMVKKVQKALL